MEVFELRPDWDENGNRKFHLIDRADLLFDPSDVQKPQPLLMCWQVPKLEIVGQLLSADVYSSIAGYFLFSDRARAVIDTVAGTSIEWLPVDIENLDRHFLLHPLHQVPLGPKAQFRANEVGNITVVSEYDFEFTPMTGVSVFYVAQGKDSPAARCGYAFPAILLTGPIAKRLVDEKLVGIRCVSRFKSDA